MIVLLMRFSYVLKTILQQSMMSLFSSGTVSNEEMLQVREEFGLKLRQKIQEIEKLEIAI